MLQPFLVQNSAELVTRTQGIAAARRGTSAPAPGAERGIAPLLEHVREAPRQAPAATPGAGSDGGDDVGPAAARHGRTLLERGWSIAEVVHGYGDLRQAAVELAFDRGAALGPAERRALDRCVDGAIAAAVAEYARLKAEATSHREVERLGQVGHDLRTQLQTALLSFRALRTGKTGIDGSAGDALCRSLGRLRDLIGSALSEGRLVATSRVSLAALVHEVAVAADPYAAEREIRLTVEPAPGDPALAVDVDPRLLASALMNLLRNACKYTRVQGHVTLRTRGEDGRVLVEVEDECGGLESASVAQPRARGERRGSDRAASGQGLSSSRRDVQANGGEVHVRNLPGKGCIFGIHLAAAAPPDP